ncbi:hypothetical protein F4824DRAFT_481914 [Ustulina deusta]|nr:hypothetical protein F4824DRAFT_481914 [Ustulina deusta]
MARRDCAILLATMPIQVSLFFLALCFNSGFFSSLHPIRYALRKPQLLCCPPLELPSFAKTTCKLHVSAFR